ncbi:tyrosine-type recombinase/integrase [Paenibacillus spongiae]|uniref:Tyrosine-type recombinase/integrase n=1 Tax=Paenibacillus spongiae TaxID=2909671 RepID=A0ABY5SDN0_9BACL|nr:tyrosine-type recombinase/integrase [Paenibacillus spongiae]UVI32061.1 tyrosine-type recombinase/integrase [Paenibacillus spongiae]
MLLKFAIKDYLAEKEYNNLSDQTIETYATTLNEFQAFCAAQEVVDVDDVSSTLIKSYLLHCQKERGNNATTRNGKFRRIKIFFNYLENEEIIDAKKSPIRKLSYVREDIKIEAFTDYQINQMLNYFRRVRNRGRTFRYYRDYSIVIFLLGTGIRLGELVNLKWNDINFKTQVVTVWGKKREQSSIPITNKLAKELAEYKAFSEQYFGKLSEYVFPSETTNKQMTVEGVKSMFQRLKVAMNFSDVRLSAHTFRHTFAHRCLMAGMDIFSLQKMLRHSNLAMTQKYLSIWGTALKSQNDLYNPLNDIQL